LFCTWLAQADMATHMARNIGVDLIRGIVSSLLIWRFALAGS